jgi:DNA polymerase
VAECFFDTETRGVEDLISRGLDVYWQSAQVTIVTWAVDNDPVSCWDLFEDPAGDEFYRVVRSGIPLTAHNAPFDRSALNRGLKWGVPVEQFRCTRAQSYAHGLPGSLEMLGLVLGLSEEERKLSDGKRLIDIFCKPQEDGSFVSPYDRPVDWAQFKTYAIQDTATLRRIYRKLPRHNYGGDNLKVWHLTERTNARGFGFDVGLAQAAAALLVRAKSRHDATAADLTGGAVEAVTQRDRLLRYLASRGLDIANMRASTIREYLESSDIEPGIRSLLELRLEASKSSGAKYKKGLTQVGTGARMRYCHQFNGAGRTGRDSHKGYQPGNQARPVMLVRKESGKYELQPVKAKYIDAVVIPAIRSGAALSLPEVYGGPNEAAALALRHCIIAAPGNALLVGDWSNIEGRILAWIAGELWKLAAFREKDAGTGADLYKLLYSRFFGRLIDTINDTERQAGKVVDLSMGFHGGVGAFVTMAAGYGIDLTVLPGLVLPNADGTMLRKAYRAWRRAFISGEDYDLDPQVYQACDVLKQLYRASSPAIDQIAYDLDNAIKGALSAPGTSHTVGRCTIWYADGWLIIQLPSGRRLLYADAKLHTERREDPESGKVTLSEYVSYRVATREDMVPATRMVWALCRKCGPSLCERYPSLCTAETRYMAATLTRCCGIPPNTATR